MRKKRRHDIFFRFLFDHLEVARAFFVEFLPNEIRRLLDFETLAPVDAAFAGRSLKIFNADKLFSCQFKSEFQHPGKPDIAYFTILLLLEHKSFWVQYPHLQIRTYQNKFWEKQAKNGKELIPIIPMILYHGKKEWEKKDFHEYFINDRVELSKFNCSGDYILIDLSKVPEARITSLKIGFLAIGLLMMKHSNNKRTLRKKLEILAQKGEEFAKTDEGRAYVEAMMVYLFDLLDVEEPDQDEFVEAHFIENLKSSNMNIFEAKYHKGKIEGKIEGIIEGLSKKTLDVITKLILKSDHSDDFISTIAGVEETVVAKIRAIIAAHPNDFNERLQQFDLHLQSSAPSSSINGKH